MFVFIPPMLEDKEETNKRYKYLFSSNASSFSIILAALLEIESSLLEHRDNEVSPYTHYAVTVSHIIMQNPTDQAAAQASIPSETTETNASPNTNRTVQVRRKAAKRTNPFDLVAGELHLMSSLPPPQAGDIPAPARKKRRIEEPLSTTIVSVGLSVVAATLLQIQIP
jgi:hypothetical protein